MLCLCKFVTSNMLPVLFKTPASRHNFNVRKYLYSLKTNFLHIVSTICSISQSSPCLLSCPYLHRTTGDTERKYHLRYYKTGTCIHETDARGHCVKNGLHCAFAHGPHDLRPPVYDIRWRTKQIAASLFPCQTFYSQASQWNKQISRRGHNVNRIPVQNGV